MREEPLKRYVVDGEQCNWTITLRDLAVRRIVLSCCLRLPDDAAANSATRQQHWCLPVKSDCATSCIGATRQQDIYVSYYDKGVT